ncbi:hypothetical protein BJ875DRAFT_483635 [Amylocarpus encephaloides]|uniref:Gastric mucin-like protein n=1 Tax=Amylocarpus encephaloides TaxID=45428 RepID=A0A9P7YKU6_9HELO|nr:hypothetical protein BJ875DRAFT_483635 [Amylocarpus encephaloides]
MEENTVEEQRYGKLVALEGDSDTISTQLRLLPPSQKIMVLRSFRDCLEPDSKRQPFDARTFIRDVYFAFIERMETARSFLKSSTTKQPRLVFMNGGSVCARTTCIAKISEKITNGDIQEAEDIFNQIAQYGVTYLLEETRKDDVGEEEELVDEVPQQNAPRDINAAQSAEPKVERLESPSARAMKAADALDRETAYLQNSRAGVYDPSHIPELHNGDAAAAEGACDIPDVQPDQEDSKVPESQQKSVAEQTTGDDIITIVLTVRDRRSMMPSRSLSMAKHERRLSFTARSSCYTLDDIADGDPEGEDPFLSMPPCPGVVYGEAELVDVQTAPDDKRIRKAKSVDGFYNDRPRRQESSHYIPELLRQTTSAFSLGNRSASIVGFRPKGFQTLPKKIFLRAPQTVIKRSSESTRTSSFASEKDVEAVGPLFVDRGHDTANITIEEEEYDEDYAEFEPVFPLVEDLVIQVNDGQSNEVTDSVIRSYKNGSYPMIPPLPESVSTRTSSLRPIQHQEEEDDADQEDNGSEPSCNYGLRPETDHPSYESRHSYDPYSSNERPVSGMDHLQPPKKTFLHADRSLPTPGIHSDTFSPKQPSDESAIELAKKFIEFSTADSIGTIVLQDSLRSLLSVHLPAGDDGYSQYSFSMSPESNRLWKPVFRNDDHTSRRNEGKTVDQIICLGCENGVRKDFFNKISGHIERFGMKEDGIGRSSKIDITYLIANMMQSYCSLPLTIQSTFNPLSEPTILASMLIPQIEAYLASNTRTRLLILYYPENHLPTVYALRQLIGADILKVAGVINSLSFDPPSSVIRPCTPISKYSSDFHLDEAARLRQKTSYAAPLRTLDRKSCFASSATSPRPLSDQKSLSTTVSYSKANYLLTSTATDTEVTIFLSEIWQSLMEKSPFYNPEPRAEPMIVEKLLTNSPNSTPVPCMAKNPITGTTSRPRTPNRSSSSNSFNRSSNTSPAKTSYISSIESKLSTTCSAKPAMDGNWENFYVGDEDSDDDEYDKMILGRKHAKIVPEVIKTGPNARGMDGIGGKKNRHKALKWLGLA